VVGSHGAVNRRREKRDKFKDEVKKRFSVREEGKPSPNKTQNEAKRKEGTKWKNMEAGNVWDGRERGEICASRCQVDVRHDEASPCKISDEG
jgi:hypothetical protein